MIRPIVAITALLAAWAVLAHAEPPPGSNPTSETAKWYKSLKSPHGISCCSEADCRVLPSSLVNGHWVVEWRGRFLPIPDEVVDHTRFDNPTGHNVTCLIENYVGKTTEEPMVMCFFQATGT